MKKLILLFTVACISLSSFAVTIIYVKTDGSSIADGLSWANAVTLDRGRSLANLNSDNQIWMKAGTYNLTAAFNIAIAMNIYGGFIGTETALSQRNWVSNQTILNQTAALQVIWGNLDPDVLLDGLILQGGHPTGSGACGQIASGTTLRNCIIRNNTAVTAGQTSVLVTYAPASTVKKITIDNCLIINNETAASPSVLKVVTTVPTNSVVDMMNTTIANNLSQATNASGVVVSISTATVTFNMYNSIVYNNLTGAVAAATASATTMTGVGAKVVYNNAWDVAPANNTASANNIVLAATPFASATGFVGAANGGSQLFSAIEAADFRLNSTSTCINTGNNSYATATTGLGGTVRIQGTTVDMGCYEFATPSAPVITAITPSNTQLSVEFTAGSDGGSAITNYKYSTDGGSTFTACSPVQTTSPIVISGLTNDISYAVQIKAVSAIGDGTATASTSATPSVATALARLKTEANVRVVNGQLIVTGADAYSVYNTQGQALSKAISSEIRMALQAGIYLVKVGTQMHKIIVR